VKQQQSPIMIQAAPITYQPQIVYVPVMAGYPPPVPLPQY
jgi:hypothetical protein